MLVESHFSNPITRATSPQINSAEMFAHPQSKIWLELHAVASVSHSAVNPLTESLVTSGASRGEEGEHDRNRRTPTHRWYCRPRRACVAWSLYHARRLRSLVWRRNGSYSRGIGSFSSSENVSNAPETSFKCPQCETAYKVVRVEASPTDDISLVCLSCGEPLQNRDGKFALKYFRTEY